MMPISKPEKYSAISSGTSYRAPVRKLNPLRKKVKMSYGKES
jgi:hypothetical protein